MQAAHFALLDTIMEDFRLGGMPKSVLAPLEQQRTCREAYFHLQGALYVAAGL